MGGTSSTSTNTSGSLPKPSTQSRAQPQRQRIPSGTGAGGGGLAHRKESFNSSLPAEVTSAASFNHLLSGENSPVAADASSGSGRYGGDGSAHNRGHNQRDGGIAASNRGTHGGGNTKKISGSSKKKRGVVRPMVALPRWENDRDHKNCMNCFTVFSLTTRRHHCRRCGKLYCSACCYQQTTIPEMYGEGVVVRVCISCSCPLFRLGDAQLQFVQVFLPYRTHDKLLRVCKRFQKLVIVPFPRIVNLATRFHYREVDDVLHVSKKREGSSILRCADLHTGQQRAVKIVRKDSMYSRGDWQSLQFWMDTASILNHPAFPNLFDVVQSPEAILIISELIPPNTYVPLRIFAQTCRPDETAVCRVIYNILDAILYLQNDVGLVHRNLSPETILVDPILLGIKITGLQFAKRTRGDGSDQYHRPVVPMNFSPYKKLGATEGEEDERERTATPFHVSQAAAGGAGVKVAGGAAAGATSSTSTTFTSKSTAAALARHGNTGGGGGGGGGPRPGVTTSATTPGVLRPLPQIAVQGDSTVFSYRSIRRPPPLQLNVDKELERKSALYSRTAKHRSQHEQSDIEKLNAFAEPPQSAFPSSTPPPTSLVSPAAGAPGVTVAGTSGMMSQATAGGGGIGGRSPGYHQEALCASPRGSPGFAAPEVVEMYASRNPLTNQRLTPDALEKWDVYSCGALFYFMLTHGKPPWETSRWEVLALRMYDPRFLGALSKKNAKPYQVTKESIQLLEVLMAPTANLRCSASQALQSPVFAAETLKQNMVPPTAPMQRTRKKTKNEGPFR